MALPFAFLIGGHVFMGRYDQVLGLSEQLGGRDADGLLLGVRACWEWAPFENLRWPGCAAVRCWLRRRVALRRCCARGM